MRVRKGDKVKVLSGKDRGHEGEVVRTYPLSDKIVVAGANIVKRHTKPTSATTQGGIIEKAMPIHISNVALLCSKCGQTRAAVRFEDDGSKVRTCAKCGGDL